MLSSATRFRARGTVVLSLFVLAVIAAACGGSAGRPASAARRAATGAPGGQAAGPNEQPRAIRTTAGHGTAARPGTWPAGRRRRRAC